MTRGEAIGYLRMAVNDDVTFCEPYREMCKLSIEALEKQIPKKTKNLIKRANGLHNLGKCPVCGINIVEAYSYCPKCGQRIDWSEAE